MKIISLDVENIKRISAAFVTTEEGQSLVTIGGKNGQGKSSLLDAIAMALGGKRLCPVEPIQRGRNMAHVTVDLGPYLITRRFWRRETITCDQDHAHTADCIAYGDVDSSLTVKSPDGADYKSPQALLDKLVSDLTFDPLGFLELSPKDQREHVRRLVGLDFTALDGKRTAAVARQSEAATVVKMAERDVAGADHFPDGPTEPVDLAALLKELAEAERLNKAADLADQAVAEKRRSVEQANQTIKDGEATIDRLRQELAAAESGVVAARQHRDDLVVAGKTARATADHAKAAVPDTVVLRQRIADAQTLNDQVAANRRYQGVLQARDEAHAALVAAKATIADIDAAKRQQLAAAAFPVPGLAFSDDGLTFEGLPFEQASYAQQLRVAVAMGLACNPKLKVLLIKHGNALDVTSLRLLAELADAAGAQVWLERVAESADGVSVFISEGVVVPAPEEAVV